MKKQLMTLKSLKEVKIIFYTWFLLRVAQVLYYTVSFLAPDSRLNFKVGIESGIFGWQTVFLQELRESLMEQIKDESKIMSVIIDRSKNYLLQVIPALWKTEYSDFIFDVRTGSQAQFQGLIESFVVGTVCTIRKIEPIVILTDASTRLHRFQAIIITALKGHIVTFLDPEVMKPLFPHNRVNGPQIMPISKRTMSRYSNTSTISETDFLEIKFQGFLYPKRLEFFDNLIENLRNRESCIKINLTSKKSEEADLYWQRLSSQKIIVTTTFQHDDGITIFDRHDINQLVFRISEGLAMGCLVFVMRTPGSEKCFTSGHDFIEFCDFDDLADKLIYYSENCHEANQIARQGRETYFQHIESGFFWKKILRGNITSNQ